MRYGSRTYLALLVGLLLVGPAVAAPIAHGLVVANSEGNPGTTGNLGVLKLIGLSLAVFGSITRMKDGAAIASKYVTRASSAAKDYGDGVSGAGSDWQSHSMASETSWEQGTQQAITDKRYMRGIDGKAAKYVGNATKLGTQRYPQGVANAQAAYQAGAQPYFDKLKGIASQLPPRGPRRSPQNQQRSNMVAVELGKLKVGK